jgi:hypothetical protein
VPEPVDTAVRKGDFRGGQLHAQIENLTAALEEWRKTRKYSQQTEERLAQITVQCARMVESWQQMDRRLAGAGVRERSGVGGASERRVQPDTGERIRALERTIEHEWEALAEGLDEPGTTHSPEHSESLAERPVSAMEPAGRAMSTVDARLTSLEKDLSERMAQLSRDLQAVLVELRNSRPQPAPGPAPAFSLESVMRIHDELRDSDRASSDAAALPGGAVRALPQSTEAALALTARVETLERAVRESESIIRHQPTTSWRPRHLVIAVVVALGAMALIALWMQRRMDTRLNDAAARVTAVEQQRDATVAQTREEASRQVADARQSAAQAQIVGNVLAAPDRLRYWLTGVGPNSRAYAQLLFSRSRGIVFSASRLPAPGDGKAYQLWLLTRGGPVSAGIVTPDEAGRATLSTDRPLNPAGRITGPLVTLEPAGGSTTPSGPKVLIRVE